MKVVEYTLISEQPIKIANNFLSKAGETETIYYIPGSTLRGVITNSLVGNVEFERIKRSILSEKVSFLNAYPMYKDIPLIPSPKGFYENKKQDGTLQNVVKDGKFDAGMKRAKLGQFCYIKDNNTICYMSIDSEEMLNIDVKNQNIYRNNYIPAGYTFKSYIMFYDNCDTDIITSVKEVLQASCIRIGSERTSGFGKMKITDIKVSAEIPFSQYSILDNYNKAYVYMMLLSPMSMRGEFGEPSGINERELGRLLGVSNLKVEMASTSVIKKRGFNRVWKTFTPEYLFYEQGSVFKLSYDGVIASDNLRRIEKIGLGIGRNEGNGRVIFIKDYENVNQKKEISQQEIDDTKITFDKYQITYKEKESVMKVLTESAKRRIVDRKIQEYIIKPCNRIDKSYASNSQAGVVLSMCKNLRYDLDNAEHIMNEFFNNINSKAKREKKHSTSKALQTKMVEKFQHIMETGVNELFDINDIYFNFDKREQMYYKLTLIEQMITFANRANKVE